MRRPEWQNAPARRPPALGRQISAAGKDLRRFPPVSAHHCAASPHRGWHTKGNGYKKDTEKWREFNEQHPRWLQHNCDDKPGDYDACNLCVWETASCVYDGTQAEAPEGITCIDPVRAVKDGKLVPTAEITALNGANLTNRLLQGCTSLMQASDVLAGTWGISPYVHLRGSLRRCWQT